MIRKDGEVIWVQDEASLVQVGGGTPYWQGFLLDVTERKVAEEQLARALEAEREAAQQLRALDEMKNTFLQAVSHDLRTPLAAILGLAVTLERRDVELEANDARDLARPHRGERAQARPTGHGPARYGPARARDRVAEARVGRRGRSRSPGASTESEQIEPARLTIDVDPVVIPVDASKVERIVENLLANTARHTPVERPRVGLGAQARGGALIKVEDERRRRARRAPRDASSSRSGRDLRPRSIHPASASD